MDLPLPPISLNFLSVCVPGSWQSSFILNRISIAAQLHFGLAVGLLACYQASSVWIFPQEAFANSILFFSAEGASVSNTSAFRHCWHCLSYLPQLLQTPKHPSNVECKQTVSAFELSHVFGNFITSSLTFGSSSIGAGNLPSARLLAVVLCNRVILPGCTLCHSFRSCNYILYLSSDIDICCLPRAIILWSTMSSSYLWDDHKEEIEALYEEGLSVPVIHKRIRSDVFKIRQVVLPRIFVPLTDWSKVRRVVPI